MQSKVLRIFKLSFRQVIASGAQDSFVGNFGGSEEVFNILTERKKVDHALKSAILPKKKWKDKGLNTKKGQAKKQRKARVSLARGITSKPEWKPRHQTTSPSRTSRTPLWLAPRSTYVSPSLDQILSASPSSLLSGMWGL